MSTFDDKNPAPLRQQLQQRLRQQIQAAHTQPGDARLPSVRHLAQQYGVSKSTVANAIAALRQEGVLSTRAKQGIFVRGVLRTKRPRQGTLAIVCVGTSDIFQENGGTYFTLLRSCFQTASQNGYRTLSVAGGAEDPGGQTWLGLAVDGVVYVVPSRPQTAALRHAVKAGLPLVVADYFLPKLGVDCVMFDNVGGTLSAVRELLRHGHRRIALINSDFGTSAQERELGYRAALKDAGLACDPALLRRCIPCEQGGEEAMRQLLREKPTAAFAFCDEQAIGAIRAAEAAGLKVPRDFSIIGFGAEARRLYPERQLTTIAVDVKGMGRAATERLIARLQGFNAPPEKMIVHTTLLPGQTVAQCRTGAR